MAVPSLSLNDISSGVSTRARRRRFTAEYKAKIVQEAELCRASGEIGSLLRREGLYSSQLTDWKKQYKSGAHKALAARRGPAKKRSAEQLEIERLEKEVAGLRRKLDHAEQLIGLQKKLSELMSSSNREDPDPSGGPR
jgi:transposase-like protein